MGAGFDRIAKVVASDMPRRKVLKLLAGGALASLGAAITGEGVSAHGGAGPVVSPEHFGVNQSWPPVNINHPWPPLDINQTHFPGFINRPPWCW